MTALLWRRGVALFVGAVLSFGAAGCGGATEANPEPRTTTKECHLTTERDTLVARAGALLHDLGATVITYDRSACYSGGPPLVRIQWSSPPSDPMARVSALSYCSADGNARTCRIIEGSVRVEAGSGAVLVKPSS